MNKNSRISCKNALIVIDLCSRREAGKGCPVYMRELRGALRNWPREFPKPKAKFIDSSLPLVVFFATLCQWIHGEILLRIFAFLCALELDLCEAVIIYLIS